MRLIDVRHLGREQVSEQADPETAEALFQAVPPGLQWLGLDRYWKQRAEQAA